MAKGNTWFKKLQTKDRANKRRVSSGDFKAHTASYLNHGARFTVRGRTLQPDTVERRDGGMAAVVLDKPTSRSNMRALIWACDPASIGPRTAEHAHLINGDVKVTKVPANRSKMPVTAGKAGAVFSRSTGGNFSRQEKNRGPKIFWAA